MGHFRSFRVGVEAARSRQKMAENLEEANRRESEEERLASRKKVHESWEREQAAAEEGVDVDSSSDSDIQCYLGPKGCIKKTTTRVIKHRQGDDINPRDNKARRLAKRRKALAAARLAKKKGTGLAGQVIEYLGP